jgi:hypothetical protein
MQFILMLTEDPRAGTRPRAETDRLLEAHRALAKELRRRGKWVGASRLRPASEASTIARKEGEWVVRDGPFAGTKEAVGGYYVIDCDSKEEAIEWAKKLPVFEYGRVEVRPLWDPS